MTSPVFQRIALLGIGLINGSLARTARERHLAGTLVAYSRTRATRERARELDLVDHVVDTVEEAVAEADLVVLGTPVSAFAGLARQMGPVLSPGAIVTDVGSVKQAVIEAVAKHLPPHVHLVPGHPIAGTEHSGPDAAISGLFDGRWCILTPTPDGDRRAVEQVAQLWRHAGMDVEEMTPEHHDQVLAITSHVPHLIAFSIVGTVSALETQLQSEVMKYAAGGFRDFTRIAASDPTMWKDVFLSNKEAVLEMVSRASEDLAALQRMIRYDEADALVDLITRTRDIRKGVIAFRQE